MLLRLEFQCLGCINFSNSSSEVNSLSIFLISNLDLTPSLNSRFRRLLSILTSLMVIFLRKEGSNSLCSVLASRCSFSETLSLNQIGCNSFFLNLKKQIFCYFLLIVFSYLQLTFQQKITLIKQN